LTIEEFIRTQIGTVDCLRALLLLQSDPGGKWDLMTVSGRLYLPPEVGRSWRNWSKNWFNWIGNSRSA
jgi:hypothetical protein